MLCVIGVPDENGKPATEAWRVGTQRISAERISSQVWQVS